MEHVTFHKRLCNGDTYSVLHDSGAVRSKRYVGVIINAVGERRICCQGTPFHFVAKDYFEVANAACQEALDGKNPYVSRAYAKEYAARRIALNF